MRPEMTYQEFTANWAKAVATKDPFAILSMNLSVAVRCRSCKNLINAEDSVKGSELYCPKCSAGWVVWAKQ
jgi:hypothetical protein